MFLEFPQPRVFDVWYYTLGHMQLVLRSLREQNPWSEDRVLIQASSAGRLCLPMQFSADAVVLDRDPDSALRQGLRGILPEDPVLVFLLHGTVVGYLKTNHVWHKVDQGAKYDPAGTSLLDHMQSIDEAACRRHQ